MEEYEALKDFKYAPSFNQTKSVKEGEKVTLNADQGKHFQKCAFVKSLGRDDPQGEQEGNKKKEDGESSSGNESGNSPGNEEGETSTNEGENTSEDLAPSGDGEEGKKKDGSILSWAEMKIEDLLKYAMEKHDLKPEEGISLEDLQMKVLEKESD